MFLGRSRLVCFQNPNKEIQAHSVWKTEALGVSYLKKCNQGAWEFEAILHHLLLAILFFFLRIFFSPGSFLFCLFFGHSLWLGEGNGILLQCSCLENPMDRGACWAAVYGVTQNRTRLKWLSSSSMTCGIVVPNQGLNLHLLHCKTDS